FEWWPRRRIQHLVLWGMAGDPHPVSCKAIPLRGKWVRDFPPNETNNSVAPLSPLAPAGERDVQGDPLPIFEGSNGNPASSAGQALALRGEGGARFRENNPEAILLPDQRLKGGAPEFKNLQRGGQGSAPPT